MGTVTDYTHDAAGGLKQVQVAGNSATQITNTYNIRGFKTGTFWDTHPLTHRQATA